MPVSWPRGEPTASFVLPLPPSVNEIWVGRGMRKGYARSAKYKAWAIEAGWTMNLQCRVPPAPVKRSAVLIEAGFNRRRDLDNGVKAVLDLLKSFGTIVDDRWVDKLLVERVPGDRLTVSVWAL